ncbi:glycoside hydrolase [Delitschia confertaspora ATCC 74209]|uniref:glucan 1,3-beta-glucosidase n=1 Tax=Delitschia confertaspora ATCC 74209 TaxID=1513339 RepID=A0A9P4MVX6_9PLEO|nr:glycoside hydrolase [Delitschia confertaspora ATCC 74209]
MPRGDPDYSPRRDRDRSQRPPRTRDRDRDRYESDDYERDRERDRERRRRKGHRATDSNGELLPRPSPARNPNTRDRHYDSDREREREHRRRARETTSSSPKKKRESTPAAGYTSENTGSGSRSRGSAQLSLDAIAKLDKANAKKASRWRGAYDYDSEYVKEVRRKEAELERERVRAQKEERRREKERLKGEGERRRMYESEGGAEEEARRLKRERRVQERERENERRRGITDDEGGDKRRFIVDDDFTPSERDEKRARRREEKRLRAEQKKRRVVSGPLLEEGGNDEDYEYHYMMEKRGGDGGSERVYTEEELSKRKKVKRIIIAIISILLILVVVIVVAVMVSKKNQGPASVTSKGAPSSSDKPSNSNLAGIDKSSIPDSAKGGILDPFSWYDTTDFNVTYTSETIGGLPIMGLNSTWNDDVQANSNVPNLKKPFEYGKMPVRGVNVGGWLSLEPFITPSFFQDFKTTDGVIDEYTLCAKLGATRAKEKLEAHYSTFVNKQTFQEIRDAGFDHVRIPFSYWAVTTYPGDPYVPKISWRYLLRGIEYARQNGLRVNLDLHGAPGSQNGWNHSGRQGVVNWLNGTDGDLNAQRTLDIHTQLSTFFSQPRYKNVVTMYGIVNEPRMVDLDTTKVLTWTEKAIDVIRKNGITAHLIFGDGFMGLEKWQGKLQSDDKLVLDVHQYTIFNINQVNLPHTEKLNFACKAWTQQTKRSSDRKTGFGPTMCGEWSQADTDCAQYLNNVGIGTRWEGTMNTGNASTSVLDPKCPTNNQPTCSCEGANADPGKYSETYRKWLYQFAIAQMISFEEGWGWFYWNWDTETAVQWSWRKGMAANILPKKVWEREFSCDEPLDDYGKLGLSETY